MWRDLSVNFVVSLKTENLTEGKFCFVNFTKKFLKGFAKTKLINTHFIYWNFDTPTPCLALYFTAHWTKQTLVVLQFQLDLYLTSYLIAQLVKFQLSSNMSHFLSPSKLWNAMTVVPYTQFSLPLTFYCSVNCNGHCITYTNILTLIHTCLNL